MKDLKPILICTLSLAIILLSSVDFTSLYAQVDALERRCIRIGSLQNHFTAYGSERAWNNSYYEGLQWPADYDLQDNSIIKRFWIATSDFTDVNGKQWDKYGLYFASGYVGYNFFPVELKQTAKFAIPAVYVDGKNTNMQYARDYDEINPDQKPDRIITNVVNTSLGLTVTRKIYAFSQQYHDNYFIKEFTYTNTGNVDYDQQIELSTPLTGLRIGWGTRYSVCREGASIFHSNQFWGKHSWVTKRGENYSDHANDTITEANPIVDWLRCGFQWAGQYEGNSYDNIGAPDIYNDGRLAAPQQAGIIILHVDKSAADGSDDPLQPAVLGWHAGDTYPVLGDMIDPNSMSELYSFLSGNPYNDLGGTDRFDETYMASHPDPWTVHNDGGGTNLWVCYGPFDLDHGESITIVEAEGVNGLSRQMCTQIGRRWKQAYDNPGDTGPFTLPDGTETNDKDEFKNSWVYSGKDSILLTFGRAKRNYDTNYSIPHPPPPPDTFEVRSEDSYINLHWSSNAEIWPTFTGYKIFRTTDNSDKTYEQIFACGQNTNHPAIVHDYKDTTVQLGFQYYYYILSYDDGSTNTSGITNPVGSLHSNRFFTKTGDPAYLTNLDIQENIISKFKLFQNYPNPFNPSTKIKYSLPKPQEVKIEVYNTLGQKVEILLNQHMKAGNHEVEFSAQKLSSGIYLYRIEAGEFQDVKKMILLR